MLIPVLFEEWRDLVKLAVATIGAEIEEYRLVIDERLAEIEKSLLMKIDTDFIWKIDELAERAYGNVIYSDYFHVHEERYKMRLYCDWLCNYGNDVRIYFSIYASENDEDLPWPFERNITVTITNQESPKVHKTVTIQCRISRPQYNYHRYSEPFIFLHSDLSNAGLLLGNNMIVKCIIDYK